MNKIQPPLKPGDTGAKVADLHKALALLINKKEIPELDPRSMVDWRTERALTEYGKVTHVLVTAFERAVKIPLTELVDAATAKALNKVLERLEVLDPPAPAPVPDPEPDPEKTTAHKIVGRVFFAYGAPAHGLIVRLNRELFGGKFEPVEGVPDQKVSDDGSYSFSFQLPRGAVLKVFALDGNNKEVPLSLSLSDLSERSETVLDLVAGNALRPLDPEYTRLTKDLKKVVKDLTDLANAKEDGDRRDLTVLNRSTGWDARNIAMAALAERLAKDQEVALPQEGLYALMRVGLPTAKADLARIPNEMIGEALKKANEAGIATIPEDKVKEFTKAFDTFAAKQRLSRPLTGSKTTIDALLTAANVAEDRDKFAKVLASHTGNADELWTKAKAAGVKPKSIAQLQRQGRMAYLTGNNLKLTSRLMGGAFNRLSDMVDADLHEPATWEQEVRAAAGNDDQALAEAIPANYTGAKVDDRLKAYAEDMARKVRMSYPMHTVARTLAKDNADVLKLGEQRGPTSEFLKKAADQGFRLGVTPVQAFMNSDLPAVRELDAEAKAKVTESVGKVYRAYQVTPDDRSMSVLMSLGLTSAQEIMEYSELSFTRLFNEKWEVLFPGKVVTSEPKLTYQKAKQINHITYNLFLSAQKLAVEPRASAFSAAPIVHEEVKNGLIRRFPNMEDLFGAQDMCECEHCRSVLSPAAYLVDLLQFIDPKPKVWADEIAQWPLDHGGQAYPHNLNGAPVKPIDALLLRRPDLPHIALTCENTHTAMPYIDVVNEVLEYYVANQKLDAAAARDTGNATTAELLAEPQHVITEAYEALRDAKYPLGLPFDPWTDAVRRFCEHFDTPLHALLELFRTNDALFATDGSIDHERIGMARLRLSPEEAATFTDPAPLADGKWSLLYGLWNGRSTISTPTNAERATVAIPDQEAKHFRTRMACTYVRADNTRPGVALTIADVGVGGSGGAGTTTITFAGEWPVAPAAGDALVIDPNASLSSAREISRRLGITYKDLLTIVRCGFANPGVASLRLLQELGVTPGRSLMFTRPENVTLYNNNRDLFAAGAVLTQAQTDRLNALTPDERDMVSDMVGFNDRIAEMARAYDLTEANIRAKVAAIPLNTLLVLADPDAGCSFERTLLQRANGDPLSAFDLLRINLLVRLSRKLGWSLEETDHALQVLVPRNMPFTEANVAQRPLRSALVHLAHVLEIEEALAISKRDRTRLLTLWADLPSFGERSLYAQLFLTRRILRADDVFDHPFGEYLDPAYITARAGRQWFTVQKPVALADRVDPAQFAAMADTFRISYDDLTNTQTIAHLGLMDDARKGALNAPVNSQVLRDMLNEAQALGQSYALIKGHLPAIQGALGLKEEDVRRALTDAGSSLDAAQLSMANLSLLHRYAFLAKVMRSSVSDVVALKGISGSDPFKALHPLPLTTIDQDAPYIATLRTVRIMALLKERGIKVDLLDHLVRHADPANKFTTDTQADRDLIGTMVKAMRAIGRDHAVPSAETEVTDELLAQKLGLFFPAAIGDRLMGMLRGTVEWVGNTTVGNGEAVLTAGALAGIEEIIDVRFNSTKQLQTITFRGTLMAARRAAIVAQVASPVLARLLDDVDAQARAFFDTHCLLRPPQQKPGGGFLAQVAFAQLFDPALSSLQQQANKRRSLAEAYLPFLRDRLCEQAIIDGITARLGIERSLAEGLLTDTDLVNAGGPLIARFKAASQQGVSAVFTNNDVVLEEKVLAEPSTKPAGAVPVRPANANGVRMEGYFEAPTAGAYRFRIRLDRQAQAATLLFTDLADATVVTGTAAANNTVLGSAVDEYVELLAGRLYRIELTATGLNPGEVHMTVEGEQLPEGTFDRVLLLPARSIDGALDTLTSLAKATKLFIALGFSEREIRFFLEQRADFGGFDLLKIPARTNMAPAAAADLFGALEHLFEHAQLCARLVNGASALIDVYETNVHDGAKAIERFAAVVLRTPVQVRAALHALKVPDKGLKNARVLLRVFTMLERTAAFGASIGDALSWTRINTPGLTGSERAAIAEALKGTVKAHHDEATWAEVAKSVFDPVRQARRDALVNYLLNELDYDRVEQLYEHFLIDPGMEPVVQTSRIRLAIASVQLFIQRSLLNMEPLVHPGIIKAEQWEWMKRYRVWEANRKIFLFPENWLEPEFRSDKSHLFKELEGALMQGDVSADLAEDAFLTYLRKLDELARLDIVAMHLDASDGPLDRTLHVIGRTFGLAPKYFYRRYRHRTWTPWEPIGAEIESDHLVPVIWRDRLYLFWVTFREVPGPNPPPAAGIAAGITQVMPSLKVEASLHWSEYVKGEWTTRASTGMTGDSVIVSAPITAPFVARNVFVNVSRYTDAEGSDRVMIHLNGGGFDKQTFVLEGRNSPVRAASDAFEDPPEYPFNELTPAATRYASANALALDVLFQDRIGSATSGSKTHHNVLNEARRFNLLLPNNRIASFGVPSDAMDGAADPSGAHALMEAGLQEINMLVQPFFYQDQKNTFYVEPTVQEYLLEEYREYVTTTTYMEELPDIKDLLDRVRVKPKFPMPKGDPWDPEDPLRDRLRGKGSLIYPVDEIDSVLNHDTLVRFDDTPLDAHGDIGLEVRRSIVSGDLLGGDIAGGLSGGIGRDETVVIRPGSDLGNIGTNGGRVIIGDGGLRRPGRFDSPAFTGGGLVMRNERLRNR